MHALPRGRHFATAGHLRSRATATAPACWPRRWRSSACSTASTGPVRSSWRGSRWPAIGCCASGDMLLWVVAVDVLLVADARPRGDLWPRARARARAHATGSLFAVLSVNLWQGFAQWRRGRLDDALQSVRDATEQIRMWGGTAGRRSVRRGLHRGHPARPRRRRRGRERGRRTARSLPADRRGRAATPPRHRPAAPRPGPAGGGAGRSLDADVGHFEIANPAWAPWRHPAARALAALGRGDEALALADEQVALLRRWGAPSALGSALRLAGELRGAAGRSAAAGGGRPARADAARRSTWRGPGSALGRRPELGADEAVPLLAAAAAGGLRLRRAPGGRGGAWPRWPTAASRPTRTIGRRPRLTGRERQVLDLTAAAWTSTRSRSACS